MTQVSITEQGAKEEDKGVMRTSWRNLNGDLLADDFASEVGPGTLVEENGPEAIGQREEYDSLKSASEDCSDLLPEIESAA